MSHAVSERSDIFHKFILVALAIATFMLITVYAKEGKRELAIYFLDIGQGDAIYIRTPSGRDMLVDAGPTSAVVRRLSEVMPWHDRAIDVVVETHPDADHIGGMPEVMERYSVGVLLEPGIESPNAVDDEVLRVRGKKGIDRVIARAGMRIDFGDGSYFDLLFPDSDVARFETNTASIVGRLSYGSTSVMLTGDSPQVIEEKLALLYGTSLQSDILKAGHHGSHTSSGARFVDAVAPRYAVISLGKDNRYGHPHKEVIDVFLSRGVTVWRTDKLGTVGFSSDGERFVSK